MNPKDLIEEFLKAWYFTRSETLEILHSLNDKKLKLKPQGEKFQPLFWEFGCIGRTQIVFTEAVKKGKMDFSLFHSETLPKKTDYKSKKELVKFLFETNNNWLLAIKEKSAITNYQIKWPDSNKSIPAHILSLIAHERLHHGQFISYFTMLGIQFPKKFKSNWAL